MSPPNFDLGDLRAFVAVADLGAFGKAALQLHLSAPALSRRIDKLEEALGVRLFERTTRRVDLTTVGRSFAQRARHVLNELESSLLGTRDLAQRLAGQVTIACVPSAVAYFLPDVIREYHRRFPGIRVRLTDEASSDILLAVARGEADFGLTYIGSQEPDVEFRPVLKDPFVVACARGHPLARQRKVSWSQLAKHEYMTLAQGSGNRTLIDLALADAGHSPQWFCEVHHVPALISLIEAGLGVAVVPRLAMPPASHANLVSIPLVEPAVSRTLGIIRRRGRPLPAAAQQFHDLLVGMHAKRDARSRVKGRSASP
jgi:DNA-binding transcriptional LysR family regulator